MRGYKEGGEEKELLDTKYRIQSFQDKKYEKAIFIIFENIGFSIKEILRPKSPQISHSHDQKVSKKLQIFKMQDTEYWIYGIQSIGHRTLYIY